VLSASSRMTVTFAGTSPVGAQLEYVFGAKEVEGLAGGGRFVAIENN